jgi:transposase
MRTKLLRKLRKRFTIEQRNNEFRTKDNKADLLKYSFWWNCLGFVQKSHRDKILHEARLNYKKPKKTL